MNATFNIKVNIDAAGVVTKFNSEKIDDMDTGLMTAVLKVFSDMGNRVKMQMDKYYINKEQIEASVEKTETDAENGSSTIYEEENHTS